MTTISEPMPGRRPIEPLEPSRVGLSGLTEEECEPLSELLPCQRVRVYVWEVPVRVTHWVTVATVLLLSVTGGYIADPFLLPATPFMMNTVRFIHMLAAFTFLASGVLRTYWLFAGNQFANWRAFIPTNRRHLAEFGRQTGWYLFLRRELPAILGHNALAAGTYLVVFFLFLLQTLTGFALEGVHGGLAASLFGWLPAMLGIGTVRVVHHLLMWAILAFMIHHVYSALLVDHWEKSGLMSSIFSGFKFVTRRDIDHARDGGIHIQEISR
ncbi:MAG TPA: Ni/Fe-hydrogenase, b-type cytochrome subunit [Candidatus Limnocylindrales bacterium]